MPARTTKPPPRNDWSRMGTEGFAVESERESILCIRLPDYPSARQEASVIANERQTKVFVVCRATRRRWPVKPSQS